MGRPVVLEMVLPDGFEQLQIEGYLEEGHVVVTESGFYDTMAVPPGSYELVFFYRLPIDSSFVDFSRELSIATSQVFIFSELSGFSLEGISAETNEMTRDDGSVIRYYLFDNMAPGQVLSFRVAGFADFPGGAGRWIASASAAALLLILAMRRFLCRGESC
jgi:hypothetical protein